MQLVVSLRLVLVTLILNGILTNFTEISAEGRKDILR
jgi:hypothetical protein